MEKKDIIAKTVRKDCKLCPQKQHFKEHFEPVLFRIV